MGSSDHGLDPRNTMQIWVDADACPKVIKDFSAAPFRYAWVPGQSLRRFTVPLRWQVRGSPSLANPLSGEKVHWTFSYSASPLA